MDTEAIITEYQAKPVQQLLFLLTDGRYVVGRIDAYFVIQDNTTFTVELASTVTIKEDLSITSTFVTEKVVTVALR